MKENIKKVRLSKLETYILYFFIYSFLGWCFETLYAVYELGHFTKRGFLFGPMCPIYGYGALILLIFLRRYKKNSLKLFCISAIVLSAFEYLVSFGLEGLFKSHWWDYTNEFFNLNGRISILFTFVWGIAAILFINHIHPFVKKHLNKHLFKKIHVSMQSNIVKILFCICVIDTISSCIIHTKFPI